MNIVQILNNKYFWQDLTAALFIDELDQRVFKRIKDKPDFIANFIFEDLELPTFLKIDDWKRIPLNHFKIILENLQLLYNPILNEHKQDYTFDQVITHILGIIQAIPNYPCYLNDLKKYHSLIFVDNKKNKIKLTDQKNSEIIKIVNTNECLLRIFTIKTLIYNDENLKKEFPKLTKKHIFKNITSKHHLDNYLETNYFNLTQLELQALLFKLLTNNGKFDTWDSKQYRSFRKSLKTSKKRELVFLLRQFMDVKVTKTKFNAKFKQLTNQLTELNLANKILQKEDTTLKDKIEQLTIDHDKSFREINLKHSQDIQKNIDDINTQKESNKIIQRQLQDAKDENLANIRNIEQKLTTIQNDKRTLEQEYEDEKISFENENDTISDKLKRLQTRYSTIHSELKTRNDANELLTTQLSEQKTNFNLQEQKSETKISKLEREIEEQTNGIRQMETNINNLQNEIEIKMKKQQNLTQSLEDETGEKKILLNDIEQLNAQLRLENIKLLNINNRHDVSINQSNGKIQINTREIGKLNAKLKLEKANLIGIKHQHTAAINDLNNKIQNGINENEKLKDDKLQMEAKSLQLDNKHTLLQTQQDNLTLEYKQNIGKLRKTHAEALDELRIKNQKILDKMTKLTNEHSEEIQNNRTWYNDQLAKNNVNFRRDLNILQNDKRQLAKDKQQIESTILNIKEELKIKIETTKRCQNKTTELQAEITSLQNEIETREQSFKDEHLLENEEKDEKLAKLKSELEQRKILINDYESKYKQHATLQEQYDELNEQNLILQTKLNKHASEQIEHIKTRQALNDKNSEITLQLKKCNNITNELKTKMTSLETEIETQVTKYQLKCNQTKDNESKINEFKQLKETFESEKKQLKTNIQKTQQTLIDEFNIEKTLLTKQIKEGQQHIGQLQDKIDKNEENIKTNNDQLILIQQLQEDKKKQLQIFDDQKDTINTLQQQFENEQHKFIGDSEMLKTKQAEFDSLKHECDKKINEWKLAKKELMSIQETLEFDNKSLNANNSNFVIQWNKIKEYNNHLVKTIQTNQDSYRKLKFEHKKSKTQLDIKEKQNQQLLLNIKKLTTANIELTHDKNLQQNKITNLKLEHKNLLNESKQNETNGTKLHNTSNDLSSEIEELNSKINDLEDNKTRMAAELKTVANLLEMYQQNSSIEELFLKNWDIPVVFRLHDLYNSLCSNAEKTSYVTDPKELHAISEPIINLKFYQSNNIVLFGLKTDGSIIKLGNKAIRDLNDRKIFISVYNDGDKNRKKVTNELKTFQYIVFNDEKSKSLMVLEKYFRALSLCQSELIETLTGEISECKINSFYEFQGCNYIKSHLKMIESAISEYKQIKFQNIFKVLFNAKIESKSYSISDAKIALSKLTKEFIFNSSYSEIATQLKQIFIGDLKINISTSKRHLIKKMIGLGLMGVILAQSLSIIDIRLPLLDEEIDYDVFVG
jgi:chromosome segregation ATPase